MISRSSTIATILVAILLFPFASSAVVDVSLTAPANDTWTSDNTPVFSFTANSTTNTTMDCDLTAAGIPSGSNASVANSTATTITANRTISDGAVPWNITCDDQNATNVSATWTINVDTLAPTSVIHDPANQSVGQDTTPTISFNLTDNLDGTLNYTVFVDGVHDKNGTANNDTVTPVMLSALADGWHTVIVEALDEAGNSANSTELSIAVDTTPPAVTVASPDNDSWLSNTTPRVTFTLTDTLTADLSYTIWVDGIVNASGAATNATETDVDLAGFSEGLHTITVQATDDANLSANSTTVSVTVDVTPPNASVSQPAADALLTNTSPIVTFTLADLLDGILDYVVWVDDQQEASGTAANATAFQENLTGITQGSHSLQVQVTDEAGNPANSTAVQFTIDTTAPNVSVSSPTEGAILSDPTPDITVTLVDAIDTDIAYTVFVDGVANQSATLLNDTQSQITLSMLEDGPHNVTVEATDDAGWSANGSTINFTVDTSPPEVAVASPNEGALFDASTLNVTFTLTDNLDDAPSYRVFVDGAQTNASTAGNGSETVVWLPSQTDGQHNITVEVTDHAGLSVNSSTLNVTIDMTAPDVSLTSPTEGAILTDATPDVVFTLSDAIDADIAYRVFVDGSITNSSTADNDTEETITLSALGDGAHNVTVEATDDAGWSKNGSTINFTVDTSAPDATIAFPADGHQQASDTVALNFTLTDDVQQALNYTVFVDGSANATGNSTNDTSVVESIAGLPDGQHEFIVEASDGAAASNSSPVTVTVDTTAPTTAFQTSAQNTSNATVTIGFTLIDATSTQVNYTLYIDGAANASGTAQNNTPTTVNVSGLDEGRHTFVVEARDALGNTQNSTSLDIDVDRTNPGATIAAPTNGTQTADDTPQITFTLTDAVSTTLEYILWTDGTAQTNGSTTNGTATDVNASSLPDGNHTIIVQVTDSAGNTDNSTAVTITVDATAPNVTLSSPVNGSTTAQTTIDVAFTAADAHSSLLNYTIYLDDTVNNSGQATSGQQTSVNISGLAEGMHTVIIGATDAAGNTINSTASSLTIDTTDPQASLSSPANGSTDIDGNVTFTFTLTDNLDDQLDYRLFIDGSLNATGSAANNTAEDVARTLANGAYTWLVEVTDEAGNAFNSSANTVTVSVDTTSPVIENVTVDGVSVSDGGSVNASEREVSILYDIDEQSLDTTNVTVKSVVKSYGTTTVNDTRNYTTGTRTVTIQASDTNGNTDSYSFTLRSTVPANLTDVSSRMNAVAGVSRINITTNGSDVTQNESLDANETVTVELAVTVGGADFETDVRDFILVDADTDEAGNFTVDTDASSQTGQRATTASGINITSLLQFQNFTRFLPITGFRGVQITFAQNESLNASGNLSVVWIEDDAGQDVHLLSAIGSEPSLPITTANMGYTTNATHVQVFVPHLSGIGAGEDTEAPNVTILTQNANDSAWTLSFSTVEAYPQTADFCSYSIQGGDTGTLDRSGMSSDGTNHSTAVSLTAYTNGTYDVNVTCTDADGRTGNDTITVTITDTTAPTQSSLDSSDVTTSAATLTLDTHEEATCRYSDEDDAYTDMSDFDDTDDTEHETRITGLDDDTTYTYYIRCNDGNGNIAASGSVSFTTDQAESSSGSGGGSGIGGGGGGLFGSRQTTASFRLGTLDIGERRTLSIDKDDLAVQRLRFTAREDTTSSIDITVKAIAASESAARFGREAYQYISIEHDDFAHDDVEIVFTIPNDWLSDAGLTAGDIAMYRFSGTTWEILETEVRDETPLSYEYLASSPGMSYFVIGQRPVPATKSPAQEEEEPEPADQPLQEPTIEEEAEPEEPETSEQETDEGSDDLQLIVWVLSLCGIATLLVLALFFMRDRHDNRRYR